LDTIPIVLIFGGQKETPIFYKEAQKGFEIRKQDRDESWKHRSITGSLRTICSKRTWLMNRSTR
jgi:hypothetical protein